MNKYLLSYSDINKRLYQVYKIKASLVFIFDHQIRLIICIHYVFYFRFLLQRTYCSIVSIFFRSKNIETFSKKAEEQNKKDNPKVILYEFLNLIGNQENNFFVAPIFKNQLMLQKNRLNFESVQMEVPHSSYFYIFFQIYVR